jgi:hypothetical protein
LTTAAKERFETYAWTTADVESADSFGSVLMLRLLLLVAPDVKIISLGLAPMREATWARAVSTTVSDSHQ